ncbi:hypothetical protein TEA_022280 [Camellia sinensis var. sinensis]|uniref:Uncharacterized protein n=1 Tax=Camellia sinensis var. sinensis TaxID=542762 RepID=A0A4V6RY01_CAMSN|nr:hypothetical protein TEA_022280 [Camellia sinensis var. sinensis]
MAIPYQTDTEVGHPWRIILIQNDTFNLGFIVASKMAESIGRTSSSAFRARSKPRDNEVWMPKECCTAWMPKECCTVCSGFGVVVPYFSDARGESRSGSINSLKPKIQKVQPMLREVESNKKCYDPWVVSIGPCHHGKPELEACERIKIRLARLYLKDSSKETVHELYKEVVNVAGEARNAMLRA